MPSETDRNVDLQIGHILFLDIVGYSKLTSNEQRRQLELLNQIVRATDQFRITEAADKLIRLPTGDGMALAFFTTPDAPARCAASISKKAKDYSELRIRMGVHSGPVDVVHDVNDRPNITGAGINMAQRVMDCADAGHILLSKRSADDLSQYDEWKSQLHDLGEMEVKHAVRVPVVNFYNDEIGNSAAPTKLIQAEEARHAATKAATRRKRRRLLITTGSIIFTVILAAVATWAWQRRIALASAYKAGLTQIAEKSVAVLPFENLSEEKENTYLADGVQDDILTDLTKVADLKVISRRSVAQFRDSKESIRQIGQALQVAHVLQGTVRKVAGRIHVTAQLIDTRSEAQTWAEKYDRDIADVIQIQNDISQAIVTQLKVALSPAERSALEEKPTNDKEAYDLYMRARSLLYEAFGILQTEQDENNAKAVSLLESAIARDPNFVLAYCSLSDAYFRLNQPDKGKQAIDNALRIAPDSGEAHAALSGYLFEQRNKPGQNYDEIVQAAEKEAAIAEAALPGRADIVNARADYEEEQGKWKQALADREKAVQLDPRDGDTIGGLGYLYVVLRRYDQAERRVNHAIEVFPQQSIGPFCRLKSSLALAKGDAKTAMAALDSSPGRNRGLRNLNHYVAQVLVFQRNYAKADEILQTVEEVARANKVFSNIDPSKEVFGRSLTLERRGRIARFRGETDKARELFEAARSGFEKSSIPENSGQSSSIEVARALMYVAEIDAALGHKEDALRQGRKVAELLPRPRKDLFEADLIPLLAIVYLWSGERDAALQELAEAVKFPALPPNFGPSTIGISAGDLKLNPIWDELRNDPRFDKIIAEASKPIDVEHPPNASAKN